MNNTCPTCGALYAVTPNDVGRRLNCKKCGTPLAVADAGLVAAADAPPPEPAPRPPRSLSLGGFDPLRLFHDFGGFASLLFGFGAFLVIVFVFLPVIGKAGNARAKGYVDRLKTEWTARQKQMRKEKKPAEDIQKVDDDYAKRIDAAEEDAELTRIGNLRDAWLERYGLMFGFLFTMAGSLGFLMPHHTTARRVVGAVVLSAQLVLVFVYFVVRDG